MLRCFISVHLVFEVSNLYIYLCKYTYIHICIFGFQCLVALEKDNLPLGNISYCICRITVGYVLIS